MRIKMEKIFIRSTCCRMHWVNEITRDESLKYLLVNRVLKVARYEGIDCYWGFKLRVENENNT